MSSRAFRFQAWLQEREGRSFASSENSGRDNPDLVHGSRAARRAVIQEQEARATLYPRPPKVGIGSMSLEQPDPTPIHLPRGVRLIHVSAEAESWEDYDRLPWEERATFDTRTGDRHPYKRTTWSTGRITVCPPVNVPRDGEFGVRRELVR